ncbi:MAG: tRNA epoxyqueuosine(34) reductase QueG [Marinilabiliales bacterium]|nr:tRNA epoxyqueuosine(34) reductase QueG [Marinilabiliales bacterium]
MEKDPEKQKMHSSKTPAEMSVLIKAKAAELGFEGCGISSGQLPSEEAVHLREWLEAGFQGTMDYMNGYFEKRTAPLTLVEGARSVITVLQNYYTEAKPSDPEAPILSIYAYGKDYHSVVKAKLNQLLEYIRTEISPCEGRVFTDSAPMLEKALAREAGLGWIGKNTLLIHPRKGSYHFLGELIIDLPLQPDQPFGNDLCGSCTRCMDSCPTQAIRSPRHLDARRCISYLTIESREDIPEKWVPQLGNKVVGCDICQQVCPWNSKALLHQEPQFDPSPELLAYTAAEWQVLDQPSFKRLFKGTAVERTGFRRMKRTLAHLFNGK